jgi:uncharacterized protein (TIGR02145 family)
MKTKKFLLLFLTIISISLTTFMQGQVTVGGLNDPQIGAVLDLSPQGGYKGGLLLPNVSITNYELIPNDFTDAANNKIVNKDTALNLTGIIVYNTNHNTKEGVYYWDGYKWKAVTSGNNSFVLDCDNINTPVPHSGGSISCTAADPDCEITGAWQFNYIVGENYSSITDLGDGGFSFQFDATDLALSRVAIIIVTSPCGHTATYVFTQAGDTSKCTGLSVPLIKSYNTNATINNNEIDLCGGGAVYLYLDGNPTNSIPFFWTLNGELVGAGTEYIATKPGKYIVYANNIGCENSRSIQVKMNNGGAPIPVSIFATNNGLICSESETVTLYANLSGNIVWYKDGKKTGYTGSSISAGKGTWFAVVESGTCSSVPSNTVTVMVNPAANNDINMPTVKINRGNNNYTGSVATNNFSICGRGILLLEVQNPQPGVVYNWYLNDALLGTGTILVSPLPFSGGAGLLRCMATKANSCPQETDIVLNFTSGGDSNLNIISTGSLCNGSVDLVANNYGGGTLFWFYIVDDKVESVTETTNKAILTVNKAGIYRVSSRTDNCLSAWSEPQTVTAGSYASILSVTGPTNVNVGDYGTYTVLLDNATGATYEWAVDSTKVRIVQQNENQLYVQFLSAQASIITISVSVKNVCGEVQNSPYAIQVSVRSDCVTPSIVSYSPAAKYVSIAYGSSSALTVLARGGGSSPLTYRWYDTSSPNVTVGNSSTFILPIDLSTGVHTYRCEVSACGTTIQSDIFTVNVSEDPGSCSNPGNGVISGRTLFDVAMTEGSSCGSLSARRKASSYADFTNPSTRTQTYTFTPNGTVSSVRFSYIESQQGVVTAFSSAGNTITVTFNNDLNRIATGRTSKNPIIVDIYAFYTYSGSCSYSKLKIKIQDCRFCGARTITNNWLTFMCYNLGADENMSLEEQTYYKPRSVTDPAVYGDLYQWGRNGDGHEKRTSPYLPISVDTDTPNSPYFFNSKLYEYDWRTNGNDGNHEKRWSDDQKAANDPCPAGWRVPTQKQWASIFREDRYNTDSPSKATANTWTWISRGTNGFMVGDALFLPATGFRDKDSSASIKDTGEYGKYWSSTWSNGRILGNAYRIQFCKSLIDPANHSYISRGFAVRCVEE